MHSHNLSAVFCHENFARCNRPFSIMDSFKLSSVQILNIFSATFLYSVYLHKRAASPTTSGRDVESPLIIAVSACIASNSGMPNPSK